MFEKIGEMFDDIGEKIKNLAIIVAILGMISSIIAGLILMGDEHYGFFYGLLVIIFGCIASWIGEFILYGFGELICKTTEIAENTKNQSVLAVAETIEKSNLPQDDDNRIAIEALKKQVIMDSINDDSEDIDDIEVAAQNIPMPDECPNCFGKIKPNDKECPFCGYKLK